MRSFNLCLSVVAALGAAACSTPGPPPGPDRPSTGTPDPSASGAGMIDVVTCSGVPATFPIPQALPTVAALPDPFTAMDGTRITRLDQWACRRSEISGQA